MPRHHSIVHIRSLFTYESMGLGISPLPKSSAMLSTSEEGTSYLSIPESAVERYSVTGFCTSVRSLFRGCEICVS